MTRMSGNEKTISVIDTMPAGGARKFTLVGGYPIYYVCDHAAYCPDCASVAESNLSGPPGDTEGGINWKDDNLSCDACGENIECAYPVE